MELRHIPLDQLHIAAVNMRHSKRPPDIADILPSIRARGILQPLLVRPNADGYEIVAGRRRYFSAKAVEAEQGEVAPIPCAIMEPGDDAAALEASLIENVARLDPDEVSQWETFTRLITKQGRSIEDIAATFGLPEIKVKQRLALGNLLPKIREAYRAEQIDADTIRYLTMASKAQQKDWLSLFEAEDENVPYGRYLKQWLFGGQEISTKAALFPLEDYKGKTVGDLFDEETYFVDTDMFWQLQHAAIAAKCSALEEAGWDAVHVLDIGDGFTSWEHEKTPKKKSGHVFITVSHIGEVAIHEGWLSRKEARRAAKQNEAEKGKSGTEAKASTPPEMTGTMENYLELHRHAAVRLALVNNPGVALRLLVAHAGASSGNWQVKTEPQKSRNGEISDSIAQSPAQSAFEAEHDAVFALIGLPDANDDVGGLHGSESRTAALFARLLTLSDADVLRIAAFVMANSLAAGSAAVEAAGSHLKPDLRGSWQADETFFELIRDRGTVNAMLAEVAGKPAAKSNAGEKIKTQKKIIRDTLAGANGRTKLDNWLPGWMEFPFRAYGKGHCSIVTAAEIAKANAVAD